MSPRTTQSRAGVEISTPPILVPPADRFAANTIELAWDTFQRALALDLAENTAATSTLRFMSYQAWRELYLADGVSR